MNDLQYRVNFALQVLQSLLPLFAGLVVFALVYSHTTELNGWSQASCSSCSASSSSWAASSAPLIQPNMMGFTEEVREASSITR